jgi:hypothetical protein
MRLNIVSMINVAEKIELVSGVTEPQFGPESS